jgi:hypothetical protein
VTVAGSATTGITANRTNGNTVIFADDYARRTGSTAGSPTGWWLRSPYYATPETSPESAALVSIDPVAPLGTIGYGVISSTYGVRPALRLDLSPQVFISKVGGGANEVEKGSSVQYTASVFAVANQNVTWSIVTTGIASGTSISPTGLTTGAVTLNVAAAETKTAITLRATAQEKDAQGNDVYGEVTVTVKPSPVKDIPVGGTFEENGVTWRVLANDGNGNKLIITEKVYGYGQVYNTSGSYSAFGSSTLKGAMDTWWANNGGYLKALAVKPNHTNAENENVAPWSGWSEIANVAAAVNAAGTPVSGADDTQGVVFAMSISEINKYQQNFANGSYQAQNIQGANCIWWLRSPGNFLAVGVSCVYTGGNVVNNATAGHTHLGFRPALWVKS